MRGVCPELEAFRVPQPGEPMQAKRFQTSTPKRPDCFLICSNTRLPRPQPSLPRLGRGRKLEVYSAEECVVDTFKSPHVGRAAVMHWGRWGAGCL